MSSMAQRIAATVMERKLKSVLETKLQKVWALEDAVEKASDMGAGNLRRLEVALSRARDEVGEHLRGLHAIGKDGDSWALELARSHRRASKQDAWRSLKQTRPEMISVPGMGKVWVESVDTEDTFPPQIKSYAVVDGWLTYRGRNGSEGAVYGSKRELTKWMQDVDYLVSTVPQKRSHQWTASDGGEQQVRAAVKIATKVLRKLGVSAEIRVWVDGSDAKGEATGNTLTLTNVHVDRGVRRYVGGATLPNHLQVAAHEAAHLGYNAKAREVVEVLKARERRGEEYLTLYHSIAGHFEGAMEAAAFYILEPREMQRVTPAVFEATKSWFRD